MFQNQSAFRRDTGRRCFALIGLVCLVMLSSCTWFKAKPAEDSGYLGGASTLMTEQRDRFPFNRVWVSPQAKARKAQWKNIIIAPVNTQYLAKMDWWQAQSIKNQQDLARDTKELAQYTRTTMQKSFAEDPNHRLAVVTSPKPNTAVLELAITELIPSKAWFNAAGTAAGFIIPGGGLITTFGKGSIAIEGRLRDPQTNKVLMMFADREEDKSAALNLAQLQFYAGAKEAIDDWAKQLVELVNTPPQEKVADSSPFKLVDW